MRKTLIIAILILLVVTVVGITTNQNGTTYKANQELTVKI